MSPKKAIGLLAKETIKTIDTLLINNELSVNVAGAGFDGYIAHKFAGLQDRGFKAYINLTLHEYWNYRPNTYEIIIDGKSTLHEALLVSVANSSQFGNNAHIAPLAKVDDGIFDITVIRPTPLYYAPVMATRLFAKNLQNSRYYTGYKCKEATIRSKQPIFGHIDGEAVELGTEIKIRIQPASLQILVGK
jgi:diacylglycerol kinase family enzyme